MSLIKEYFTQEETEAKNYFVNACLSGFQHSTKYTHSNTLTQDTRSQSQRQSSTYRPTRYACTVHPAVRQTVLRLAWYIGPIRFKNSTRNRIGRPIPFEIRIERKKSIRRSLVYKNDIQVRYHVPQNAFLVIFLYDYLKASKVARKFRNMVIIVRSGFTSQSVRATLQVFVCDLCHPGFHPERQTLGSRCNPRPVATGRVSCVCDWLRDQTGLDFGDRSWICNAAQELSLIHI